jgi:hypothetical protein
MIEEYKMERWGVQRKIFAKTMLSVDKNTIGSLR